ncbi:hypothetical protein [Actinomadura formosensis]
MNDTAVRLPARRERHDLRLHIPYALRHRDQILEPARHHVRHH